MRREIASQKVQVKKATAPAAKAFFEEQARADQVDHDILEEVDLEVGALEAPYAWEDDEDEAHDFGSAEGASPAEIAAAPMLQRQQFDPQPPPGAAPYGGGTSPRPARQRLRGAASDRYGEPDMVMERTRQAHYQTTGASGAHPSPSIPKSKRSAKMSSQSYDEKTSEELQLEATGAKVVETGFWIWRNVIVPPNVYVVHTRRGLPDPVTIGLGKSFRFNPLLDSYLVVPAAMQTIGIFAKCISTEKQGINVLAYVQWLISDFSLAYQRLDFSNINDPMGIVNSQLREQAEAAIKDTVATMSVEQVLKDKAPIIQELTERMKSVAEGRDGDGLGLKIVTVQIKEAVVASSALWENLQAPFRHEKARIARLSEIELEAEIHAKGREAALNREAADARAASEIAKIRAKVDLESSEAMLDTRVRQQDLTQKAEQEEHRYRQETELQRIAAEQRMEEERQKSELLRIRTESERTAEESRLDAERSLQILRATMLQQGEDQRLYTQAQQEAVALQESLAIARLNAQMAELEIQERLNSQRRAADGMELAARVQFDKTRHEAKLLAERLAEQQRQELAIANQQLELVRARGEAEVERQRQETANSKTAAALQGDLVATLPAIAAHMPEIQEYRYLGMSDGKTGDGSPFAALPDYLAKALGIASSFGWRFNAPEAVPKDPE